MKMKMVQMALVFVGSIKKKIHTEIMTKSVGFMDSENLPLPSVSQIVRIYYEPTKTKYFSENTPHSPIQIRSF